MPNKEIKLTLDSLHATDLSLQYLFLFSRGHESEAVFDNRQELFKQATAAPETNIFDQAQQGLLFSLKSSSLQRNEEKDVLALKEPVLGSLEDEWSDIELYLNTAYQFLTPESPKESVSYVPT